jgi:hypothetical protein
MQTFCSSNPPNEHDFSDCTFKGKAIVASNEELKVEV